MALWTLQSDSILQTHRRTTTGVTIHHATTDMSSHRSADAYVDDTDTYAQASEGETMQSEIEEDTNHEDPLDPTVETDGIEETMHHLNDSAQKWSDLVAGIGHLMAFHKCCWQILGDWEKRKTGITHEGTNHR